MNIKVCKAKSVRLTYRLALLTLFLCVFSGAMGQTNNVYVYLSGGHYLAHCGSEVTLTSPIRVDDPTSFNPNTNLWEAVPISGSSNYNLRAYGTENLAAPYYLNTEAGTTFYYAMVSTITRPTGSVNGTLRAWPKSLIDGTSYPSHYYRYHSSYGWIAAENNSATPYSDAYPIFAYLVTITENAGSYQGPQATISGADELDDFGTYSYSASPTITTVSYNNYAFNNVNHYWYDNSDHSTAPDDWSGTLTSTWSIDENGGCATINASNGSVTVHKIPGDDLLLTLRLTVSDGTHTCVFAKIVVLRGSGRYVIKDDLGNIMYLSGSSLDASTTFNPDYTVWDTEANTSSSIPTGVSYTITSGGTKYYLCIANWVNNGVNNVPTEARVSTGETTQQNEYNRRWVGIAPSYLRSAGSYFTYRNSPVWSLTQDASVDHRVIAYPATFWQGNVTSVSAAINEDYSPITELGNYSYTATPNINSSNYSAYTFDGSTHYWFDGSDHGSTAPETWGEITASDLTQTWSLDAGAAGYATVNSSTGELNVTALPTDGPIFITLTCTITHGSNSLQVNKSIKLGEGEFVVHNLSEITDPAGEYRLAADFSTSGTAQVGGNGAVIGTSTTPFTGLIDGHLVTITGTWNQPLFDYVSDATIRNVIIEEVGISSGTNVGAFAGNADGETRIYNCGILSGSVGGTNYVGGLVGKLDGTARVINCYSFADITSGAVKAGIVGYNNYASKYNDLKTMVMNCMFYGNIDYSSGSVYPIYGGLEISNDYKANTSNRLNNYNYFLYEAPFSKNNNTNNPIITDYNCGLAAEERFLVRFEFYRHLLNSNRELATWYVTGSTENAYTTMQKWVLDKEIAKYPILKQYATYPSIVNYDPMYTFNPTTGAKVERINVTTPNQGGIITSLGTNGSLTINIGAGSGGAKFGPPTGASITTATITRPIIDKDTAQYNFNYGKVQLPYYNEVGSGNYTKASDGTSRVVTGWKIVSMSGGTAGGYTETNYDAPNYNYADREHYGKDIYGTDGSNRIFAQGAYFNVPTGVTAITIQPYWAKCAYLSDKYYDRYGYNTTDDLEQIGGLRYTNNTEYPINGVNQKVYTTFAGARDAMGSSYVSGATVYDYAVVLVGNYHHHTDDTQGEGEELSNVTAKPLTVTSIDNNRDNEPDYCLIFRSGKQKYVCPIRYDFITLPGMAMAHKMATHENLAIPGNCKPRGWFEITTTGLIKFGQFEHSYEGKTLAPLIFMGGVIDQFVSNNSGNGLTYTNRTKYFLFGDNVWFQLLSDGTHADKTSPTPHRPISITGGQFDVLYLSGYFRPDATACTETGGDRNAECYIDGGKFGEVAGAGQEKIDGNVTWLIDHADITSFFGGGINSEKAITGDIHTAIKNSRVTQFCGGPKFGNMYRDEAHPENNKTVVTTAMNTTFGTFFGAGYGGTSIYRYRIQNEWTQLNYESGNKDWNKWIRDSYDNSTSTDYFRGKYKSGRGVSMGYEYELFGGSKGNVGRLYIQYASFSLAQVNDVTSTLEDCTIMENFYGGGSFGAVMDNAVSTLKDCTVYGNVFGAGYSVQTPTVKVLNNGGFSPAAPHYNTVTGVYEGGEEILPASVTYTWHQGSVSSGSNALVDSNHTIITNQATTGLGQVNGNVTLTLFGNTTVGTEGDNTTGNVFGGGQESVVAGNTTVTLQGKTMVLGNVFGGGDQGVVGGNATVTIEPEPEPDPEPEPESPPQD